MSLIVTAVLLGILEGLTEFLPVSSTGHLILATKFFGYDDDQWAVFNIVIQLGAILAVVVLYWRTIWAVVEGLLRGEQAAIRFVVNLLVAFMPAAVIGVLLMVFAAGLLADSVENLQQLGWLPVLEQPMWHSARLLSENSAFGDVLHSFFGYSDAPTPLQLLVYVGYLAIAALTYLGVWERIRARTGRPHPAAR